VHVRTLSIGNKRQNKFVLIGVSLKRVSVAWPEPVVVTTRKPNAQKSTIQNMTKTYRSCGPSGNLSWLLEYFILQSISRPEVSCFLGVFSGNGCVAVLLVPSIVVDIPPPQPADSGDVLFFNVPNTATERSVCVRVRRRSRALNFDGFFKRFSLRFTETTTRYKRPASN